MRYPVGQWTVDTQMTLESFEALRSILEYDVKCTYMQQYFGVCSSVCNVQLGRPKQAKAYQETRERVLFLKNPKPSVWIFDSNVYFLLLQLQVPRERHSKIQRRCPSHSSLAENASDLYDPSSGKHDEMIVPMTAAAESANDSNKPRIQQGMWW